MSHTVSYVLYYSSHTFSYVNMNAKTATGGKPGRHAAAREVGKQKTREALVRAATELFAKSGLDTSLDEICARAGYTRGAFYVHFRDRDELLSAVMARIGEHVLNALLGAEQAGTPDDLLDVMSRFIPALLSGSYPLSRKGGMRPHQLLDACARSGEIRRQYVGLTQNSIERLGRSVAESQRRKRVRGDVEAKQLATLLVGLVIGLHTMHDLDMPLDLAGGSAALLKLLAG